MRARRWWRRALSLCALALPHRAASVPSYVAVAEGSVNRRWLRISAVTAAFALAVAFAPPGWAADPPLRLLLLGDSLTAGYGLPQGEGFVARLTAALARSGKNVIPVEAGVSGDTSAGGRARLTWAIGGAPDSGVDAAVVELGANDALRGLSPGQMRVNLAAILDELKRRNIPTLLAGMQAPPNLGDTYAREFNATFDSLARSYDVVYYPFFLDGVALHSELNQPDGIHPNAAGVDIIVERILPSVEELLKRAARSPSTASSPVR